jgi:hypothetical protein
MASTYLKRTNGSPTNDKIGTISVWVKRSKLSSDQRIHMNFADGNNYATFYFVSSDEIELYAVTSGSQSTQVRTTRKFRDTSAWYHIVLAVDTTQGTTTDRIKMYVNGVQETSFSQTDYFGQNESCPLFIASGSNYHTVGSAENGTATFDGSMSHYHKCDGTALAPTVFGSTDSTTGEWKINTSPSFTVGNTGYTILKDGNTITDQSANSNDFTLGAGTLTKTEDNPSNVFATINPLLGIDVIGGTVTYANGNTVAEDPNGSASGINPNFISTLGMPSSGKWYCEVQPSSFSTSSGHSIGIYRTKGSTDDTGEGDLELNSSKIRYIYADTSIYIIKYGTNDQTGLTSITSGQTVGMALDLDNGTLQYYVNGSARANQITGINSANDGYDYFFHAGLESSSSGRYGKYSWNFGNGAFGSTQLTGTTYNDSQGRGIFKYQPPTNFLALCTKNLNV